MNRLEMNKLIAEFMGKSVNSNGLFELPEHATIRPNGNFRTQFTEEQLKYHSSWDWLIPVIQKIIRNHEDDVVNVKQNLPEDVAVAFELDLDTLLYDFEFSYVLSKDVSEMFDKVFELVQILKDNKLW